MQLNRDMCRLEHEGRSVILTGRQFAIVEAMVARERVFTRGELLDVIDPNNELEVDGRNVDSIIKRIRGRMRAAFGSDAWIKTVYDRGYYWDRAENPAPRVRGDYKQRGVRRRKRPHRPGDSL